MALDTQRLADAIANGIINDPDSQRPIGSYDAPDSPELRAFAYYMAKAIVEEMEGEAELDGLDSSGGALTGGIK